MLHRPRRHLNIWLKMALVKSTEDITNGKDDIDEHI